MGIKSSRIKPELAIFNKNGLSGIHGKIKNSFISIIDGDTFDLTIKLSTRQLSRPREMLVNRRSVSRPIIQVINNKNVEFNTCQRCRLLGIDTPEKNTPNGLEAIEYVKNLLTCYKKWYYSFEKNDKYGRILTVLSFKNKDKWENLASHLIDKQYGVFYNGGKK